MIIVHSGRGNTYNVLPDQIEDKSLSYIPHIYTIKSGEYILNCLTGEIVKDVSWEDDRQELIRRWYLIPENFDISSISYLMRQERLSRVPAPPISDYTIFTTMQCNARCPYCFQKDKHEDLFMNERVALDVADYIKKNSDISRRNILRWFGGEPLMNRKAIDIICGSLRKSDAMFRSYMSTNGDLMPKVEDKDLYFWNLKIVQLSIDYPDAKYDEAKGLPIGAYERLKETVQRFDELGIESRIRIHYHSDTGMEPIYKIIEDFKSSNRSSMYISTLYGDTVGWKDFEQIMKAEDLLISYRKYGDIIPTTGTPYHCMADDNYSRTITAEGGLSPCEHYSYEENYGTIYSDIYDQEQIVKWRSKRKHNLKCMDCPLFPSCELLAACPAIAKCENGYKEYRIERIKRALINMEKFQNDQRETN